MPSHGSSSDLEEGSNPAEDSESYSSASNDDFTDSDDLSSSSSSPQDHSGPAVPASHLSSLLQETSLSIRDLLVSAPPQLEKPPSPLEFLRIVHAGRPVVIKGITGLPGWERIGELEKRKTWTELLTTNEKNGKIQISMTPDGRADSLVDGLFALPLEVDMLVEASLEKIANLVTSPSEQSNDTGKRRIHYIQSQNSNLNGDFKPFLDTIVPRTLPFAEEALGKPPDAANLWLGASKSLTSLHKDPYENVYVVLRGKKVFRLLPPMSWVPEVDADVARWRLEGEKEWKLEREKPVLTVPWSSVDLSDPLLRKKYPWLKPLEITIGPGEALYLPGQWWHAVGQIAPEEEGQAVEDDRIAGTLAVNYWFDQEYGERWEGVRLVENLSRLIRDACID